MLVRDHSPHYFFVSYLVVPESQFWRQRQSYRKPRSISDSKKPKDTFIGAYTLEKYEGLSRKKK
jgi:hypothetical protein